MGVDFDSNFSMVLPSGRAVNCRPYDALAAAALGEVSGLKDGSAFDKAVAAIVETIDGEPMPSWLLSERGAQKITRGMLLNDVHAIIFMAVARFHGGTFKGDFGDNDGEKVTVQVPLLDDDGNALDHFTAPAYPLKNTKTHEFEQDVSGLGLCKFRFDLLDGAGRGRAQSGNLNADLLARQPRYMTTGAAWLPYDPLARPPAGISRALTAEVRKIDPVIQYTVKVNRPNGSQFVTSLFGQPLFFIQGFV